MEVVIFKGTNELLLFQKGDMEKRETVTTMW